MSEIKFIDAKIIYDVDNGRLLAMFEDGSFAPLSVNNAGVFVNWWPEKEERTIK